MKTQNIIQEIVLSETEIKNINSLVKEIENTSSNKYEFDFLSNALLYAQELPRSIREIFYDFKLNESFLGLRIMNGNMLLDNIPPTPQEYIELNGNEFYISKPYIIHALFSCLLGEPFSFETQRSGHVYTSIIPKKEFADIPNISSGSTFDFKFHSEDAFHPGMADYLGLLCWRNNEKASTTVSSLQGIDIPENLKEVLFGENFQITSNAIHKNVDQDILKQKKSILFGNYDDPYLRINVNTIDPNDYFGAERQAIEFIIDALNRNKISIILESGNFLYIDNFKTVHSRDSYMPNYGSEARWLTRVIVTNDLRKTRGLRTSVGSRVISNN